MTENPYSPPRTALGSASVNPRIWQTGQCPVCHSQQCRIRVFWSRNYSCGRCGTRLANAIPYQYRTRHSLLYGCASMTAISLPVFARFLPPGLSWLVMLGPLFFILSLYFRWRICVLYPHSLICRGFTSKTSDAKIAVLQHAG